MASIVKGTIDAQCLGASPRRMRRAASSWEGASERPDLLGRFTGTPHAAKLQLMGRTIHVETNHAPILTRAKEFFERHQHTPPGLSEFTWRIICEHDPLVLSTDVPYTAFSDLGLRYVNIGQRGFLAVDLENLEAVAFLSDRFVEDEARFRHRPPLDILLCMTAASLGLTVLSGACVGVGNRSVVIFGPPNSGKTTASYLAAKSGLEFHADQVVFLDRSGGGVRVWGDLFPAVFRPESVEFLPELRRACRSTYGGLPFFCFDKGEMQSARAEAVTPVCSIFLSRGSVWDEELCQVSAQEGLARLHECLLFKEGRRFDEQVNASLTALAENPIYELRYGSDPKVAARVIEGILK